VFVCLNGHRNLTAGDCVFCGASSPEMPNNSNPVEAQPTETQPEQFDTSEQYLRGASSTVAGLAEQGEDDKRTQYIGRLLFVVLIVFGLVAAVFLGPPLWRKGSEIATGRKTYEYENYRFSIQLENDPQVTNTGRFSDSLLQVSSSYDGNIVGVFVLGRPTADTVTAGSISRAADIFTNDPTAVPIIEAQVSSDNGRLTASGTYLVQIQGKARTVRTYAEARNEFTYVVFASSGSQASDDEILEETRSRIDFD